MSQTNLSPLREVNLETDGYVQLIFHLPTQVLCQVYTNRKTFSSAGMNLGTAVDITPERLLTGGLLTFNHWLLFFEPSFPSALSSARLVFVSPLSLEGFLWRLCQKPCQVKVNDIPYFPLVHKASNSITGGSRVGQTVWAW